MGYTHIRLVAAKEDVRNSKQQTREVVPPLASFTQKNFTNAVRLPLRLDMLR